MSGLLRMIAFLLALVAFVAWWLFVAITTDFNEPGLLAIGTLGFVFLAILAGNRRASIKAATFVIAVPLLVVLGVGVRGVARAENAFHDSVTRQTLDQVARALDAFVAKTGSTPDCLFPCMVDRLREAGIDTHFALRLVDGCAREFESIPMKDGWRCRYEYRKTSATGYELRSSGGDRRFETDDDIAVVSASGSTFSPVIPDPTGPFAAPGLSALNPVFIKLFFRPDL
ncbi:MAG: hypothetical protein IT350_11805 [Deltaproteobacteria bacterium]|nr:hypothetical protein [Deltaproteobacteria bacterium]